METFIIWKKYKAIKSFHPIYWDSPQIRTSLKQLHTEINTHSHSVGF